MRRARVREGSSEGVQGVDQLVRCGDRRLAGRRAERLAAGAEEDNREGEPAAVDDPCVPLAAGLRLLDCAVVEDKVLLVRAREAGRAEIGDEPVVTALERRIRRRGVGELNARDVELAEAGRATREAEEVEADPACRVLGVPPVVDGLEVGRDLRGRGAEVVGAVRREGIDDVPLEAVRGVRDAVGSGLVRAAPGDGGGRGRSEPEGNQAKSGENGGQAGDEMTLPRRAGRRQAASGSSLSGVWRASTSKSRSAPRRVAPAAMTTTAMRQSVRLRTVSPPRRHARYSAAAVS